MVCAFSVILVASERSRRRGPWSRRKRLESGLDSEEYDDDLKDYRKTKFSKLFPKVASSKRLERRLKYLSNSRQQRLRSERYRDEPAEYEDVEVDYNGGGGREVKRDKRFYPIEPGCIKGYACCQIPYCRQFCSLCQGKIFLGCVSND